MKTKKRTIVLNYDIAKAYFVDNFIVDDILVKKFNSILWLHSMVFNTEKDVANFYFKNTQFEKKWIFLFLHLFSRNAYIKRVMRKFL